MKYPGKDFALEYAKGVSIRGQKVVFNDYFVDLKKRLKKMSYHKRKSGALGSNGPFIEDESKKFIDENEKLMNSYRSRTNIQPDSYIIKIRNSIDELSRNQKDDNRERGSKDQVKASIFEKDH